MPLPWLIGAAVVGIGTAIAKSVSDSNDRKAEAQRRAEREQEQARKERAAEAQRHAELERERVRKEREQRLRSARENFLLRGERIGSDIAQSLQGWIDVKYEKTPAFVAELQPTGFAVRSNHPNKSKLEELIPAKLGLSDDAHKNLAFYSSAYSATLQQGTNLTKAIKEISEIEKELNEIGQLKEKISNIKIKILQNA